MSRSLPFVGSGPPPTNGRTSATQFLVNDALPECSSPRFPFCLDSEAMKTIRILIRVVSLAVCVVALVFAFKGYDGSCDWRVEDGRGESYNPSDAPVAVILNAREALDSQTVPRCPKRLPEWSCYGEGFSCERTSTA
jgi:hypothetical protein